MGTEMGSRDHLGAVYANVIGNYYRAGQNSVTWDPDNNIIPPDTSNCAQCCSIGPIVDPPAVEVYFGRDSANPDDVNVLDADDGFGVRQFAPHVFAGSKERLTKFNFSPPVPVTSTKAEVAYTDVLNGSGAGSTSLGLGRDGTDARVIQEVTNRTGGFKSAPPEMP
jgi:hypothetical protein